MKPPLLKGEKRGFCLAEMPISRTVRLRRDCSIACAGSFCCSDPFWRAKWQLFSFSWRLRSFEKSSQNACSHPCRAIQARGSVSCRKGPVCPSARMLRTNRLHGRSGCRGFASGSVFLYAHRRALSESLGRREGSRPSLIAQCRAAFGVNCDLLDMRNL